MRLVNKVALITGGGTGIGRAIAELFAKEGAKVAISGRRAEKLEEVIQTITANGGEAIAIPGDVTNEEAAKQMVMAPIDRWKRLDVLVNNAGMGELADLHETTPEQWDLVMDVNVRGIYRICKYAIPEMIKAGGGSIIHIASVSGIVGHKKLHVYCASKGAVINLTRAMAISYGPQNIRVNAVSPGTVNTPLTRSGLEETGKTWDELVESLIPEYALKRLGQPIDIAYGCLYLASDESSWVTGTNLVIDGGFTAQ